MEKDVWKWLFSEMSDKSLVQLTYGINKTLTSRSRIVIKGASDLSKIKTEQIHLFRNLIEKEINKPQNMLRAMNYFKRYNKQRNLKNKELLASLSEKEPNAIWEVIQASDELDMNEMIMYLMTQSDQEQINKGIQLHQLVMAQGVKDEKNGMESGIVEAETVETALDYSDLDQDELGTLNEELERLWEENKKLQEENIMFQNENKKLQNEKKMIQEERNKLEVEKKEAIKTNRELKKLISKTESDKNDERKTLKKLESEIILRKAEIGDRDRRIQQVQEDLKKSQQTEADLRKENLNLNNNLEKIKEKITELEEKVQAIAKPKITIIDRNIPDGLETVQKIQINLIKPIELEQSILSDILDHSDEIWFIKFKLPVLKQNMLNEKYGSKVIGFSTYNELKDYCNSR